MPRTAGATLSRALSGTPVRFTGTLPGERRDPSLPPCTLRRLSAKGIRSRVPVHCAVVDAYYSTFAAGCKSPAAGTFPFLFASRYVSARQKKTFRRCERFFLGEAPSRLELENKGFADLRLTTWLWRRVWSGRRDSDPRHPPWQGGTLPLSYYRMFHHKTPGEEQKRLCGQRDLNSYARRHQILSLARLPFRHARTSDLSEGRW